MEIPGWVRMVAETIDKCDPSHDMSAYDWRPDVPNIMYVWDQSAMIVRHEPLGCGSLEGVYTMSGLWPGPNTHLIVRNADIKEICLALKAAYMINRGDIDY